MYSHNALYFLTYLDSTVFLSHQLLFRQPRLFQKCVFAGYDLGMPLQTGCTQINSTTGAFEGVNTTQEKQMAVFSPGKYYTTL